MRRRRKTRIWNTRYLPLFLAPVPRLYHCSPPFPSPVLLLWHTEREKKMNKEEEKEECILRTSFSAFFAVNTIIVPCFSSLVSWCVSNNFNVNNVNNNNNNLPPNTLVVFVKSGVCYILSCPVVQNRDKELLQLFDKDPPTQNKFTYNCKYNGKQRQVVFFGCTRLLW